MKVDECTNPEATKKLKLNGHTNAFVRVPFLMAGEEFDYTFDGVKLRVVVQSDYVQLGEEFVVPLPINFSHAHCLLLIRYDESRNEMYDEIASDVNNWLIDKLGLCIKDHNSRADKFCEQNCDIFMPTDVGFKWNHLKQVAGYFTKVNVRGEKMTALTFVFRDFSAGLQLDMTSMLVHKCTLLG